MPDKMTQERAIEIIELLEPGFNTKSNYNALNNWTEVQIEALITLLLSTTRKVEKAVGKVKGGIKNLKDKPDKTDSDYAELQALRWIYDLLTEEDK